MTSTLPDPHNLTVEKFLAMDPRPVLYYIYTDNLPAGQVIVYLSKPETKLDNDFSYVMGDKDSVDEAIAAGSAHFRFEPLPIAAKASQEND